MTPEENRTQEDSMSNFMNEVIDVATVTSVLGDLYEILDSASDRANAVYRITADPHEEAFGLAYEDAATMVRKARGRIIQERRQAPAVSRAPADMQWELRCEDCGPTEFSVVISNDPFVGKVACDGCGREADTARISWRSRA